MEKAQRKVSSEIGPLYIVASEKHVYAISFQKEEGVPHEKENSKASLMLNKVQKQIQEYFKGDRRVFDLPLKFEGTDFQKRVWAELCKIPYGKTCSYKDLAGALGNPKACRAVGTANGRNPICVVVPCHRVINAGGKLGGYTGGLWIKEKLLSLENDNKTGRL